MSGRNARTFAMHRQVVWHERAGDRSLPLWLRVAALAYGSHAANGHAVFRRGAVALCLAEVDRETGEIVQPTKQAVHRAIRAAVERQWLSPESCSLCLVVPAHAITGGLGNAHAECPQHRTTTRSGSHLRTTRGGDTPCR